MKSKSGSASAGLNEKSRGTTSGAVTRSIKTKLYVSFGFLIFLFMLVSLGAIFSQLYLDRLVNNILNTQIRFVELAKTCEAGLLKVQQVERDFFASYRERGFTYAKSLLNDSANQFQIIRESLRDIKKLAISKENIDMTREVENSITEYEQGLNATVAIIEKRVAGDGLEAQVHTAGQALEDFFRDRGLSSAEMQIARAQEQLYLAGDKKAGTRLAEMLAQKKTQVGTMRLPSETDQVKLETLYAAYGAALEKIKESDTRIQETMLKYRGINNRVQPILWDFYRVGAREEETAVAEMKQWARIIQVACASLLLLVIVFGIGRAVQLSRGIMRQVQHIMDSFSRISVGDYSARTQVTSNDELGTMALSLNSMLDSIFELIQTREERNTMQASLMKLLDDVSGVADGDLSKEAEVTQDFTGAIADAFNFAIVQLRQLVRNVQNATIKVSTTAGEIASAAEKLSSDNELSAKRIFEATTTMGEMALSAQGVSETAAQSASVADQSLDAAKQGAQAVFDTIDGMNRIRDRVQETAKRIKRLGESSQEIGEIVQMINDIADRTSILAMNASIQAAMSGESGRGFAVVAEEVERLAQRSAKATKQITELVKTIQSETNETVVAMEETTREVVTGSNLANDAGQALNQIETVSSRMASLIQSISEAAHQQAQNSEEVATAMNQISEATQQTAAGTRQAAQSITTLASMADELRDSVKVFKLPDDEKPRLTA